jgi:hypothetical protein
VAECRNLKCPTQNVANKAELCTLVEYMYFLYTLFPVLKGRAHSEDLGIDGKIILEIE